MEFILKYYSIPKFLWIIALSVASMFSISAQDTLSNGKSLNIAENNPKGLRVLPIINFHFQNANKEK